MKKLLDYLCLGALGAFAAALVIGCQAVFVVMGIGCYEIDQNLPAALAIGGLPIWAVAAFRGACIIIQWEYDAKEAAKESNGEKE